MEADRLTSIPQDGDAEWLARHSRLDMSLKAAIHTTAVDERFDEKVWTLVRAAEAETLATRKILRMTLGTPWWLDMLNLIAVATIIGTIAVALGSVAGKPLGALVASSAVLWLGLRHGSLERALRSAWL